MTGTPYFFYGTLCHAPLLAAVLGAAPDRLRPARLAGYVVHWAAGEGYPVIGASASAEAEGLLLETGAEAAARLDFYESGFGYVAEDREVMTDTGPVRARVYLPLNPAPRGAPWNLADWAAAWGETATLVAAEIMALRGSRDAAAIFRRYPQMLIRAASRLRAAPGGPVSLRRASRPNDTGVRAARQPYAEYFAVEEYDLSFRRFDGAMSTEVTRAVFVSGDAATVLPYDPVRDRVLLIEQFRAGAFARGDSQPWLLEPIAGRIDPGETPEEAARREAIEEAGVSLRELLPIASFYPSPGAKSEYLYSYLGLADLPDSLAGGLGGLADEDEDIRSHLVSYDRLLQLVESGEADNGPLLISALFLARHRSRLRAAA